MNNKTKERVMKMKNGLVVALCVANMGLTAWAGDEAAKPVAQHVTEERADKSTIPNYVYSQAWIADAATFTKFWAAWSKEAEPKIDFAANFVCINVKDTGDKNVHSFGLCIDAGVAEFIVYTTLMRFAPTGRYVCTVVVYPRAGIQSIKQFELKDGKYTDKITALPGAAAK